jgi:hypothetical protein
LALARPLPRGRAVYRSRRSRSDSVARQRRSRRTSNDPTGEKARAVKARYQGVCRCGAYTQPRNGKGDAYAYCKACHPGAIECRWTRRRVLDAIREWRPRYGQLPSSYDWSRTHAHRRGGEALARLSGGDWPAASVVTGAFGSWRAARAAAMKRIAEARDTEVPTAASSSGRCDPPAVSDRRPGDRGHRGTAAWERGSELEPRTGGCRGTPDGKRRDVVGGASSPVVVAAYEPGQCRRGQYDA